VARAARAWQICEPMSVRSVRLSWLLTACASVSLAMVGVAACTGTSTSSAGDTEGGTLPVRAEGGRVEDDSATGDDAADAGTDARDAATRDASVRDANGPGDAGTACSFNHDCQLTLRCECDQPTGPFCACKPGARGTGQNGVTPCVDGNACASSVCVEGPPATGSFCSDECETSDDCGGKLPLCKDITLVGRICIRTPPP
jgi:hypothetical protein